MSKSVGLDIHARGVRVVEVAGRGRKVKVTRYLEREVTPRGGALDPEELRDALAEIFKSGFSKNHVVAGVDTADTVVREIPVPFQSDDQIRKVIKYEAEHHLHDCDADDVVVQYTKVSQAGEGTNLLVFATRKDDISRRIEYARTAGVEPLAMDLDALAFYNAVRVSGMLDETPTCVLMNIGYRATDMVFLIEGEVRALRSARLGVDSIAQGLARDMDIDLTEASHKLHEIVEGEEEEGDLLIPAGDVSDRAETEKSHAELERDLFHQKRDDFVGRLKREYVRSTAALHGTGRPDRVILTGAGVEVTGLVDLLRGRLGTDIDVFRPTDSFACKVNGEAAHHFDAGGAIALGLALKGAGNDPLGIDFRQEELKVANKFELLKGALAVTVTLLFVGLLLFSFTRVIEKHDLQTERYEPMLTTAYQSFAEIARKYNALGENLVPRRNQVDPNQVETRGDRHLAIQRFVQELRRMRRHLQRNVVGNTEGIEQITSAVRMWNDIFSVVDKNHEEIGYIDFELIDIRQDRVSLNIILPSAAAAELLADALMKLEVFQDWDLEPYGVEPVRGSDYQRTRFNLRAPRRR